MRKNDQACTLRWMGVDYNRLADRFDERYQHQPFLGIQAYLRRLMDAPATDVLEVGCGTGHWLSVLSEYPASLLGIDPAPAMLDKARLRATGAKLVCAAAEGLPFSSHSIDLIFCINAFHHFRNPRKFLAECKLALRNTGRIAIVGLDPHVPDTRWYLYDYFPGVRKIDLERYLSHAELGKLMREAGFESIVSEPVQRIQKTFLGPEVLSDPFLKRESTSQLQLISDETYTCGRQTIARLLEHAGHTLVSFDIDLTFFLTLGYSECRTRDTSEPLS